jgi:hypothetical protein
MKKLIKLTPEQRGELLASLPPGTLTEAAEHFGITRQGMDNRLALKRKGWYCAETITYLKNLTK